MYVVDVAHTASTLPAAWNSVEVGRVGAVRVKTLRMDGGPLPEEEHAEAEVLLVLDGRLELWVDGVEVTVGAGGLFRIPPGTRHAVRPGSRGTLVIVERPEEADEGAGLDAGLDGGLDGGAGGDVGGA
ncbi:cupin domain-containing protein (plasmid) [Streptomyces sp. BI20]|uniref:cupin domain-containing protein n=1 Tax=Streptomyces sp. BI20 TaxID=3403460 RepID=UPI003C73EA10